MKKLRAWHKSLIAIVFTISIIALFGPAKLLLGLALVYIIVLPTLYLIERKTKLLLWQERLIVSLMVFPILSFFMPAEDIFYLFLGSLLFTAIIIISEKWQIKDKEIRPEWEEDNSEKGNPQKTEQR